ncbi:SagB/ThcOx family dehydrogenase [Bacillus tropicus]|uniref:SagB/ThcOx family dehydrogenase n=1 Tax=Bacillus tropicus TaxID=2026188 RepID=UPI003D9A9770
MSSQSVDQQNLNVLQAMKEYAWASNAYHFVSSFGEFNEPCAPFFVSSSDNGEIKKWDINTKLLEAPLHEALTRRKSSRDFGDDLLDLEKLYTLLWSTYGYTFTDNEGEHRTVPSAGALFPLRVYVISLGIKELNKGVYQYNPLNNEINIMDNVELPQHLSDWFLTKHIDYDKASAIILFVGQMDRICPKYGERGYRYLLLEAGHAAQNLCLTSSILSIPTVPVGGFNDSMINQALHLKEDCEVTVYSVALGRTK